MSVSPIQASEQYAEARRITNESQSLGKDEFLKILIAQMKYQDPLQPMSNTESISQMANFSSLEQMKNLNDSFKEMANLNRMSLMVAGASFIGNYVKAVTPEEEEISGIVVATSFKDGLPMLRIQQEDGSFKAVEMDSVRQVGIGE